MSRRQYATVGAVGVVALSLAATATTAAAQPAASSAQGPQRVVADFNHDGRPDLVVGVPGKDVNGKANAGAVNVFYGSSSGTPGSRRVFTQDTPGILDQSETGDQFGFSVSTGDYNGDGYTDLAVGVPYEDISHVDQGAVNVIYGSRWGLQASGDDLWTQGQGGIAGTAGARDQFGYSLASGNFGRNVSGRRYDDLAVGVPLDDGTRTDDGSVNVIYGRAGGLSSYGNQRWTQGQGPYGAGNAPEVGDRFGRTLAAGNLGRDGYDDLAVGVPYEDWESAAQRRDRQRHLRLDRRTLPLGQAGLVPVGPAHPGRRRGRRLLRVQPRDRQLRQDRLRRPRDRSALRGRGRED